VNRYTYRVEWSPEHDEHIGVCLEFPSLSYYAPSMRETIAGIEEAVDEYVDDMTANGGTPPAPLAERKLQRNICRADLRGITRAPGPRSCRARCVDESVDGSEAR
jgi:hypothetical protein